MKEKQIEKRNTSFKVLIVILLIITTIASCIGLYAWSKYMSSLEGEVTGFIAKWNFNVNLKQGDKTVTLGEEGIDLSTTTYQNVAEGRMAPGTSGEFDIIVDTTGTEVSLGYYVTITLTNCPRNIVFSKKGPDDLEAVVISEGGVINPASLERTITFTKYVDVNPDNENTVFTEKIYWDWPYQASSSASDNSIAAYNKRDTEDQGKNVMMNISVTGTELLDTDLAKLIEEEGGDPSAANSVQSLAKAGTIKQWDIVEYDPGNLTTESIELPVGVTLEGIAYANTATEWVVLDVNETTGEVKIIPRKYTSAKIEFSGMDGYNNSVEALDMVSSIYLNSKYAKSSKCITAEEVHNVEGINPKETNTEITFESQYSIDENLKLIDNGVANKNIERRYMCNNYEKYTYDSNSSYLDRPFFVARRCIKLTNSSSVEFGVGCVDNGVYGDGFCGFLCLEKDSGLIVEKTSDRLWYKILPVVTLKLGIQMESTNIFYTETATGTNAVEEETEYEHTIWSLK